MKNQVRAIICAGMLLIMLMSGGCASVQKTEPVQGPIVQKGEWVKVNYTCGAKEHGLFATTDARVADNPKMEKSRIFSRPVKPGPVNILAGMNQPGQPAWDLKDLIPEIRNQLAPTLVGKPYGTVYEISIGSSVPEGMQYNNRFRHIPRERQIPKVQEIAKNDFLAKRKFMPKVGDVLMRRKEDCPYARVIAVDDKNVTVELITGNGCKSNLPWGTLSLVDKGQKDKVTARLDSEVGLLVKTGPVIGEVVEINDKTIKIDYGHPFAGETLECRVEILDKEEKK